MNNNEIKLNSTDKQEILKNYPISKNKEDLLWETITRNYDEIDLYSDIGDWASVGLIVTGTVLALGAPIAGSAAIVLGTMLPLFWPEDPNSAKNLWESLINYAGELIDNKLNDYALQEAIAKIRGLYVVIQDYHNYRTKFLNPTETKKPSREEVFAKFNFAHSLCMDKIEELNVKSYEITLLPAYALAANMHLLLMRDGILYANTLELSRASISNGDNLYEEFLKRRSKYINHCLDFYNKGLNKFPKPINTVANLKKLNDYKLYMTINVLDIISLFSIYDIKKYPGEILPKTDLTREVYTSPLNYDSKGLNTGSIKDDLENILTRKPHLFSILKEINFEYVGEEWKDKIGVYFGSDDKKNRPFINGTICNFNHINDDKLVKGTPQGAWGWYSDPKDRVSFNIDKEQRIYQVKTAHFGDINTISVLQQIDLYASIFGKEVGSYHFTGGDTYRYLTSPYISKVSGKIDISNYNDYSHNLSSMLSFNNSIIFQTSVFGWTHALVDRENKIKSDRITQIAAVKGYELRDRAEVIKGPGFTGGDLVSLNNGGRLFGKVKFESQNTKYKVRLYYAAQNFTQIEFVLGDSVFSKKLNPTYNDMDETNLEYDYFDYIDITETLYKNQKSEEVLSIMSKNYDIIIDKIEFIPESIASQL
ncbi:insecticidal delta-endotoxin Cry8Ea1 family protein (plasmid) [Paraclostridium ghonii]|uniref:insecticidal delta-endotoxin Cry8Ea1 family protein n=1 Tax=Paraclostridium ghonii TaxID=29358 RepID=UPI00202CB162|nr:insecticidal delta-endotoxin Cry8Ea1 family protein [Paeniclostridium ghonii]MCM0165096.1 insecticidal delta-endotoxin Cry8Ea1 family protein [Paeniclostridium ghonii]